MRWTKMTKSEIESKANEVFSQYVKKGGAYKQFNAIFQSENIKYKEIDAKGSFCGTFTKSLNGQKYIMVNSEIDNDGRKNFNIAHELGHYFLGHTLNNHLDTEINEEGLSKEPIEYEADYFATCLLMPEEKITKAFKSMLYNARGVYNKDFLFVNKRNYGTWRNICSDLMKRYGVSETALRYRLKTLNLAKFEL